MNLTDPRKTVKAKYRNWRGEIAERTFIPIQLYFGTSDQHPEPQHLVYAWCVDKQAWRTFAMKDFLEPWTPCPG